MKARFGDEAYARDPARRAELIRRLFVSGMTVAACTEAAIDQDLWSAAELRQRATRACRAEVRDALGALDETGLPFAGPTASRSEGAPIWKQMDIWTVEDFDYNCSAFKKRGVAEFSVYNRMAAECRHRYGRGPKRVEVIEMDEPPENEAEGRA